MTEQELRDRAESVRETNASYFCTLYCCASTACRSSGGQEVIDALSQAISSRRLGKSVRVVPTGCMGLCSHGPLLRVEIADREPVLYREVTPLLARLILADHVIAALVRPGEPFEVPEFLSGHVFPLDLPFFTRQQKVVLANAGYIDPESIGDYLSRGGYEGLSRALLTMEPDDVVQMLIDSGLRGRGGGGFPTGLKWENTRKSPGEERFVICNGDEGDPGAYMDRSILEGDPHAVIEGMAIAAYAIGAATGWFYIRAEYPLAVSRIEKAIRQARREGFLGKKIMGTDFSFTCEIRLGAGAFVCGEETALIASIEGRRGTPRPRPPYPSVTGLWDRPTCVNNVETLASVPHIVRRGGSWYSSIGTEQSKGTKVFALTGKVRYSGLIEVPMGITIQEVVEEIGGGTSSGKPLKAVQTGGPSGGVIPADRTNTPVCYEDLKALGSIMGSGGMIVMDQDDSMVAIASFYLKFTVDESCGKCAPCRIGGKQLLGLLETIAQGRGSPEDLVYVRRIALAMRQASLCGLGQTAPNPVLSTLRYFESEYTDLVRAAADAAVDATPDGAVASQVEEQ